MDEISSGGAKRGVTQAIKAATDCRTATEKLRQAAWQKVQSGELSVEDFNVVDEQCGKAIEAAARLLTSAIGGIAPALENNLDQLCAGTSRLQQSIDKLAHAQTAVALAGSLLVTVLTVAAAIIDPTHTSLVAAVGAIGNTVEIIVADATAPTKPVVGAAKG